jgi:hypothetical protein
MAAASGPDAPGDPQGTAAGEPALSLGRDDRVVLCCAGSGIRAATFSLGVLQALQEAPLWSRVRTIVAVSGGAYIAAARTLAARDQPAGGAPVPAPYALRSPEELHLRDHTRYLLETWQVAVRGLATLTRGVLVNALLVGSVYFIAGHAVGWLLHGAGLITGLRTGAPDGQLGWWPVLPAVTAAVTLALAWRRALPPVADEDGAWRWPAWLRRGGPPEPSNTALGITVALTFALVAAPLAIRGLYTVSLGNSTWSVITRFLGFANADACRDAALAQMHACGAAGRGPAAVPALVSNGSSGSAISVKLATFASFAAAVVALARTTLGRLRTYQAELSKSGALSRWASRVSQFIRRRLVPWVGSALVVGAILVLTVRWIADAATRAPLAGGWRSAAAECLYAAVLFPLLKLLTDINSTSAHGFYRDRLAAAYGAVRAGGEAVPAADPRLSTLAGVEPELVVCAAANTTHTSQAATARGAVSFTFTPSDVGLSQQPVICPPGPAGGPPAPDGRAATADYEQAARLSLFGAVAVSAAAISPVMGKLTRPAMRILLAAADARLGVWLPNPAHVPAGGRPPGAPPRSRLARLGATAVARLRQPDFLHLWAEAAGSLRLDGRWLYVTDGAHYESLGLVEALRRRPDHVIVVDATGDGSGWFSTLGQAVAEARTETGVEVEIDPGCLVPDSTTHRCAAAYAVGRFRYPGEPGLATTGTAAGTGPAGGHRLLYLKLAVPASAPWDVLSYQDIHPAFPAASTLQQLYDDQEFEAYRALGQHCATELTRAAGGTGPAA